VTQELRLNPVTNSGSRRGTLERARADVHALGMRIEPISAEMAVRAARLRGRHGTLRVPDALVLACADVLDADAVVTADASWRRYSKRVSVIGSR
jgi:predicted nucleic acid-binding protein